MKENKRLWCYLWLFALLESVAICKPEATLPVAIVMLYSWLMGLIFAAGEKW